MLHLRPVQFVDSPVGYDGAVARLAGGMQWFAAYEVIEGGTRRTLALGEFLNTLGTTHARAAALHAAITAPRAPLVLGERVVRLDQPQVMAILNVTPDSFSDGGRLEGDPARAAAAAYDLAAQGAALIDLGGESTRPGAPLVWEGDEIKRVLPVVQAIGEQLALSIDTRKAAVMEAALGAGAAMVNDVSALLWDDRSAEIVARAGVPVVLVHSPDPKRGPHGTGAYDNVLTDVFDWLEARIAAAEAAGIDRARIVVDPGIGFGKSVADNCALINGLALFHGLGCPVLLGASRKRMIGALAGEAPVGDRLAGSLALALKGAEQGAQLLRVHDVPETVQALKVWRGLRDAALVGG